MGDAYTPGLTVTGAAVVRKARRLPLAGQVIAKVGDRVSAEQVVARTELPGRVNLLNFSNLLGVLPDEIEPTLRVRPGAAIERRQVLAEHRGFFGLLSSRVESPIDGVFESVSKVTGQAVLREPPNPVEVKAYIAGQVVEEIPDEGVIVETRAAMVQGIFGLSGEVHAPLAVVAESPEAVLGAADITDSYRGKIIVGGAHATLDALRRAIEVGVAGVVVGGFAYQDIRELLGYDVGVAVTGTEALGTTLVVTEGFGRLAMARATFELLCSHDGARASLNGATQIRAGVIRPEVIIPLGDDEQNAAPEQHHRGLEIGAPVRCIRAPYFGRLGTVSALPVDLTVMPSETRVRVVEVTFADGETAVLPRANVEVIER